MRRKRVLSATMMILGIWLLAGLCAAASDSEEEPGYMENIEESLMEEFDFQEIEEVLDELEKYYRESMDLIGENKARLYAKAKTEEQKQADN